MHALRVVGVDFPLVRKRHGGRFLVRALAEPHAAARLHRAVDIGRRPPQVALQHDTDVLRIRRVEALVEQPQRPLGVGARLHVQPHEGAIVARPGQDVVHDRHAQLFRDVEPHRGELDRHIGVDAALVDAIEHPQVLLSRGARFGFGVDALAQQVERRGDPFRIEARDGVEHLLEGLARHEALGEFLRDAVVADEMKDLRLQ